MLKNCWECVMGSPVDNEVYGTMLNGGSQNTAWPESDTHNENMFRLPRPLRHGDLIEINGTLQDNPQRIRLNLTTGSYNPDVRNIACWAEANFAEGHFHISGSMNGQPDNNPPMGDPDLLGLFPDGKFNFTVAVKGNGFSSNLDIYVFEASMGTRTLKFNLNDITFLTIDGDINKIEDLKFTYA
ncbi:uncharacterized protein LOC112052767 isoform X2 [Bicyclus anynana]|uniref:Uncharacterized protein LOC112052767 isoform X2 n=1 Tax=Bicyclus anynana TaxID=110368 RepID=A0A6J1NLD5_BICAN|nr:uncharacterized protein LOC112052767 isoform X2 [Bicyclus anynana]